MARQEIVKKFKQYQIIDFLKDMLCCPDSWEAMTVDFKFIAHIEADGIEVRNAIRDWLDVPERLQNDMSIPVTPHRTMFRR